MKLQTKTSTHSRSNLNERGITMKLKNTIAATFVATAMLGLGGCSSDSAPVAAGHTSYTPEAALAAQTATIEISNPAGIPTVTISGQPADIALTGTATRTGTSIDLMLDATNNASRILFGLKAIVEATSTLGTATIGGSDGTFDAKDYVGFDMALAVGDDSNSGTLTLTGVDGATDPIIINVTLPTDHPIVVVNQEWGGSGDNIRIADLMANQSFGVDLTKIHNPNPNQNSSDSARLRGGMFSPDGQYIYAGLRNVPWLVRLDLTAQDYELMDLTDGSIKTSSQIPDPSVVDTKVLSAYIDWVAMSPNDQYLYAAYGVGDHVYGSNTDVNPQTISLVKIERDTLSIVDSVTLIDGITAEARVRDYDFVDDSTMVVILESDDEDITPAQVISIDLDAMSVTNSIDISPANTQIRVDADAALAVPVVSFPSPDNDPTQMALSADGATAYVTFRNNTDIYTVDLTSGNVDPMGTTLANSYAHALELGPDGMLYVATEGDSLMAIDLATDPITETVIYSGTSVTGMAFSADDTKVYVHEQSGNTIHGYLLPTATVLTYTELDLDGDTTATVGPHDSISSINGWDEMLLISPY